MKVHAVEGSFLPIQACPPPPADAGAPVAVEDERRLSRSSLWKLQRAYYDRAGVAAWSTDAVPYYVTNNVALAHAYAQIVIGFLRDCAADGVGEPVTIVEIGAGSGRFAYLFLKALAGVCSGSVVAGVRVRYVMTDFTEANVRAWQRHPQLRPFVERGLLDFAVLDAERDDATIELLEGREILGGGARHPLCAIANYVFDSLPQDAFSIEGGEVRECLVSLSSVAPGTPDGAAALAGLRVGYSTRAVQRDYYGDAELDAALLRSAADAGPGTFLFPCQAIRCVRRLAELGDGRLLLLSADYGRTQRSDEPCRPTLALHGGAFSLPVDYQAIAGWFTSRGGRAHTPAHQPVDIAVTAFVLGDSAGEETRIAYEQTVAASGPDDWIALQQRVLGGLGEIGLEGVLALIRMSRWDPDALFLCARALWDYRPSASQSLRREVVRVIARSWENHYAMGGALDLPFELGLLAHDYDGHREAVLLFSESARLHGEDARTSWNTGLGHWALGDSAEALRCFAEAARLDPSFRPSGALQVKERPCGPW